MNKTYKKIFAFLLTAMVVISGTMALAASPEPTTRPRPESGQTVQVEDNKDETRSNTGGADNSGVSITVETQAPKTAVSEKHYTTRGGAFGWFLLSVLVNAVLSFVIGNRFYKMSKKNNHVSAEVRALRRDIEEKFNKNIGGFSEHDVEISNSNESYAPNDGGIKANIRKTEEEISAEETFREWEKNLAKQEAERREAIREALKPRSTREFVEKEEESFDTHRGEKSYKPQRETIAEEDYEDEKEESTFDAIKHKAKEIITDIFPFRED